MTKLFLLVIGFVFVSVTLTAQNAGDKIEILWKGKYYPGKVLEVKDGKWFISYDGYGKEWNEWIGADRIKGVGYSVGEKVNVEWKGKWYPSTIIEAGTDGKYKIHYEGWGKEWDEWVPTGRMKK